MARKMTAEQRTHFLAEPYVGVLTVAAEAGRAPLTTPIWYDYRPGGDITVLTAPGLRKARLIAEAGRFALCVQAKEGPYRYVTAEGPVVETRPATKEDRHRMASRYLPTDLAAAYVESTHATQSGNVAIVMRPDRWNTADYSDMADRLT